MEKGNHPAEFKVAKGTVVRIRVIAIGVGQFETVSSNAEKDDDAQEPGKCYLLTLSGASGQIDHVAIDCNFPEKQKPRGRYAFEVGTTADATVHPVPPVRQPISGVFPQSSPRVITFVIV